MFRAGYLMDIKALDQGLAVSGQIAATDLKAIAEAGYRAGVCNRPDGEAGDQPGFSEIEQAAQSLGMAATYLPVESGKVTDQQAQAFGTLMTQMPGPVFAYCRHRSEESRVGKECVSTGRSRGETYQ